jgi:Arc/MetJ-type ribon-helix-helix transcriptional regulator
MAKYEVGLSDQQHSEIERLVDQGDFINWEQATEELLVMGLSAYTTEEETGDVVAEEEVFTETIAEQQDPAARDESSTDDRTL